MRTAVLDEEYVAGCAVGYQKRCCLELCEKTGCVQFERLEKHRSFESWTRSSHRKTVILRYCEKQEWYNDEEF